MPTTTEHQITVFEERLRLAMLASDFRTLDELISSDLIFTNHFGQVLCKKDDIELHRSGVLKFNALEPSERLVKTNGQLAVVSVRMKLFGVYDGAPFAGDLRYTRIWRLSESDTWQIVAGHSSAVQQ
jgi:ketosteroid isomerase-like protein